MDPRPWDHAAKQFSPGRRKGVDSAELLFDKQTYTLIGERLVAVADHTSEALDGTRHIRKGDLFRLAVYTSSIIVDKVGDTK